MEIRAHPSESMFDQDEDGGEVDTSVYDQTIEQVYQNVQDFVKELAPNADLIRSFNGNFVYLLPSGPTFNPSKVYLKF